MFSAVPFFLTPLTPSCASSFTLKGGISRTARGGNVDNQSEKIMQHYLF